jgi:hypothetical protein
MRHEIIVRRSADGAPLGKPSVIWPAHGMDRRARATLTAVLGEAIRASGSLAESDALLGLLLDQTERLRDARLRLLEPRAVPPQRGGGTAPPRRALVIDEQWPRPDHDAGSQAVLSHMRALRRLGWRVEFAAADAMAGGAHPAALLDAEGIASHAGPAVFSVEELLRRQPDRYGLVYMHHVGTAAAYAALVRRHQRRARLVYSVADLHHLRLARQAVVEARPELLRTARALREQEYLAMRQVDVVITHSRAEAALLAREAPGLCVHVAPWAVRPWPLRRPSAECAGVLLVANFTHAPNLDGADWLVGDVMPRVWAEQPDIGLTIAGADLPAGLKPKLTDPRGRVRLLGHVPDLASVYGAARLAVARCVSARGSRARCWRRGRPACHAP